VQLTSVEGDDKRVRFWSEDGEGIRNDFGQFDSE
jgi:hypothetical protein